MEDLVHERIRLSLFDLLWNRIVLVLPKERVPIITLTNDGKSKLLSYRDLTKSTFQFELLTEIAKHACSFIIARLLRVTENERGQGV